MHESKLEHTLQSIEHRHLTYFSVRTIVDLQQPKKRAGAYVIAKSECEGRI
jgi:hypothetical protein